MEQPLIEPGERSPAPGPLRVIQLFVNTNDLETGPDLLPDADALRAWLVDHELLASEPVSDDDHARASALREAIREHVTPGVDGALGHIVAAIHAAVAEGTWERLKACERDICRWAFYDHSKNRSGHWCSMAVCGQREKNRRAYRRRRARAEA